MDIKISIQEEMEKKEQVTHLYPKEDDEKQKRIETIKKKEF